MQLPQAPEAARSRTRSRQLAPTKPPSLSPAKARSANPGLIARWAPALPASPGIYENRFNR